MSKDIAVIAAEDGQQSKQVEQGSDHEPRVLSFAKI